MSVRKLVHHQFSIKPDPGKKKIDKMLFFIF